MHIEYLEYVCFKNILHKSYLFMLTCYIIDIYIIISLSEGGNCKTPSLQTQNKFRVLIPSSDTDIVLNLSHHSDTV